MLMQLKKVLKVKFLLKKFRLCLLRPEEKHLKRKRQ